MLSWETDEFIGRPSTDFDLKLKARIAMEAERRKAAERKASEEREAAEEKEARKAKALALLNTQIARAVAEARAEWEEQTKAARENLQNSFSLLQYSFSSLQCSNEKLQASLRESRADLKKARHQCLTLEATMRLGWTELALAQKETTTLRKELETAHAKAAQRKIAKRRILELLNSDEEEFNAPRDPAAPVPSSIVVNPKRGNAFGGAGHKKARAVPSLCTK